MLQRIAQAVTPAVMVSACGLIALGLDNQVSRMSLACGISPASTATRRVTRAGAPCSGSRWLRSTTGTGS